MVSLILLHLQEWNSDSIGGLPDPPHHHLHQALFLDSLRGKDLVSHFPAGAGVTPCLT